MQNNNNFLNVQFVHLALTETETSLTVFIPDYPVISSRAVWMAAK